jgi:hypothetical protein
MSAGAVVGEHTRETNRTTPTTAKGATYFPYFPFYVKAQGFPEVFCC